MTQPPFEKLAVLGLGLLGGSVAAAAKERGLAQHVVGAVEGRRSLPDLALVERAQLGVGAGELLVGLAQRDEARDEVTLVHRKLDLGRTGRRVRCGLLGGRTAVGGAGTRAGALGLGLGITLIALALLGLGLRAVHVVAVPVVVRVVDRVAVVVRGRAVPLTSRRLAHRVDVHDRL